MKKQAFYLLVCALFIAFALPVRASDKSILVHIKTGVEEDENQIFTAYNVIWGALEKGYKVAVLIDASAIYVYKKGIWSKDKIEEKKLSGNMRGELAKQFGVDLDTVPDTYGEYLEFLHNKGAAFYINGERMISSGLSTEFGDMFKFSTKIFKFLTISQIIELLEKTDEYICY